MPFVTWLDHSILNKLVEASSSEDAQQLLNLFDSKINSYWIQPITSFPIPPPSQLMIPLDDSEYVLLAMKICLTSQDDTRIVLEDVIDIKLTLKCQWQIHRHDSCRFQLVAVNTKLRFLFWIIPKYYVKMVNSNLVHEWRSGIIKTTVLPANFYIGDSNKEKFKGPFSSLLDFLWRDDAKVNMLAQYLFNNDL